MNNNLMSSSKGRCKCGRYMTIGEDCAGVSPKDIIETDIDPNRDAIGRVFKSLDELNLFEIEY